MKSDAAPKRNDQRTDVLVGGDSVCDCVCGFTGRGALADCATPGRLFQPRSSHRGTSANEGGGLLSLPTRYAEKHRRSRIFDDGNRDVSAAGARPANHLYRGIADRFPRKIPAAATACIEPLHSETTKLDPSSRRKSRI